MELFRGAAEGQGEEGGRRSTFNGFSCQPEEGALDRLQTRSQATNQRGLSPLRVEQVLHRQVDAQPQDRSPPEVERETSQKFGRWDHIGNNHTERQWNTDS